jgi:hypothetical protein
MILFDLRCPTGHAFEAWFRDGATFDQQAAAHEIACPVCGSREVAKALMAPAVSPSRAKIDAERATRMVQALREVRDHVEKNFDHVGPRFAEEARKIHYGEVEKRNIYGDATREESRALEDEGIEVGRIPWLPRHDG